MNKIYELIQSDVISLSILTAALIAARIITVILMSPSLGGEVVPSQVKIGFGLTLVIMIFPFVAHTPPPTSFFPYFALLLKEVMVGVVLGFFAGIFGSVQTAGVLVDTAGGANMSQLLVPETKSETTLFANLYYQLAIVLFFVVGGHRLFIMALFESFKTVPLVEMPNLSAGLAPFLELTLRVGGGLLKTAFMLAAPVTAAVFLTEVSLGLLNRVAPTINVYFLALPVKLMLAVGISLLGLTYFSDKVIDLLAGDAAYFQKLLKLFR